MQKKIILLLFIIQGLNDAESSQTFNSQYAIPEQDYKRSLQLAQQKVARSKKNALSSITQDKPVIHKLFGRDYLPGDSWDVAVWKEKTPSMEHSPSGSKYFFSGIFHYEVLKIETGRGQLATIQIKQVEGEKDKTLDPNLSHIQISLTSNLLEREKLYFFKDGTTAVSAHQVALKAKISPAELLPLVPPMIAAEEFPPSAKAPSIPNELIGSIKKLGADVTSINSVAYDVDDFFGRQNEILWKQGQPWPTVIKTPQGISVLIKKRTL